MKLQTSKLPTLLAFLLSVCLLHSCVAMCSGQETAKATMGKLTIDTNLPGIFVADDKDEIKMEPSKYKGDLVVTQILNEGVYVKKGDILIRFDTDKLDDAIEEAQNEATDAEVELKKADAEYQTAVIDMESKLAQRKVELKQLQHTVAGEIEKQITELEKKERGIEDNEYRLETQLIDFETLKQMYEEREIQNPISAEILFDREKKSIDRTKKQIEYNKRELEYFKKFDKSKTQVEKELDVEKKIAEIKKEKVTLNAAIAEKKAVLVKAQRKLDRANEKTQKLQNDRSQLLVRSPRDGVLFYGSTGHEMPAGIIIMGRGPTDIRKELRIGGRVRTHKILLTVAKMDQLSIKMSVSEDDIQHLKNNLKITVFPDAFPNESFEGELTEVDQVGTKSRYQPNSGTQFKVKGKCTESAPQLRSGMNCRVCIHSEQETQSVLIPVSSVFFKDNKYVCYVKDGGEAKEREIQVGLSNPEFVTVDEGLSEGEEVLLSKPE